MHEKPIKQIRLDKAIEKSVASDLKQSVTSHKELFSDGTIEINFNATFKSLVINSRWMQVQLAWANLRMHCKYFSL